MCISTLHMFLSMCRCVHVDVTLQSCCLKISYILSPHLGPGHLSGMVTTFTWLQSGTEISGPSGHMEWCQLNLNQLSHQSIGRYGQLHHRLLQTYNIAGYTCLYQHPADSFVSGRESDVPSAVMTSSPEFKFHGSYIHTRTHITFM